MPRLKHTDNVLVSALIPRKLHSEVNALLLDPLHGRTKHGAFSGLVSRLLRGWVDRQRVEFAEGDKDVTLTHLETTDE
jgi:hypothetical protein